VRLLILGAGGQLGRELSQRAQAEDIALTALAHADCDITDPRAVERALTLSAAEAVVNCAAWTRVDAAEEAREDAYRINAAGPEVLAIDCEARGLLLTHLSTDFVFDGRAKAPIDESVPPRPLSVYGSSKLAGEEAVRRRCRRHQIVRTGWLYGQGGPNFVVTILTLAGRRERLRVVADQRGTPTWTGHLAPALLRLVRRGCTGTFHLTNSGEATWHDFATAILAEAGIERPVEAITTAEYPTRARRPAYAVLDNRAWRELGEAPLPHWREGLRTYLARTADRLAIPNRRAP
jgi:dTDP-4-dehydrorhamnose reductase